MKLTIYTSDGGEVVIQEMGASPLLEFVEALELGEQQYFHFDLDDGGQVWLNADHIVRVDID